MTVGGWQCRSTVAGLCCTSVAGVCSCGACSNVGVWCLWKMAASSGCVGSCCILVGHICVASAVCCTVLQHSCSVNRHSRPWGVRCQKGMGCAMSVPVPKKFASLHHDRAKSYGGLTAFLVGSQSSAICHNPHWWGYQYSSRGGGRCIHGTRERGCYTRVVVSF